MNWTRSFTSRGQIALEIKNCPPPYYYERWQLPPTVWNHTITLDNSTHPASYSTGVLNTPVKQRKMISNQPKRTKSRSRFWRTVELSFATSKCTFASFRMSKTYEKCGRLFSPSNKKQKIPFIQLITHSFFTFKTLTDDAHCWLRITNKKCGRSFWPSNNCFFILISR